MSSLPKGWKYEKDCETYLYGKHNNGCGVFRDKGKWTGNVCFGDEVCMLSPQKSRQDAMNDAIKTLKEMREA